MPRSTLLALIVLVFAVRLAPAQELDASVDLNLSGLTEADRLNFEIFKHDLENYINNYQWTTDFSGQRIRCSFQLNITGANGSDYTAQLFVTSNRPLYKSTEVTTMARFFDDAVAFAYYRGMEFQHGNSYRPLESLIDFYVNIILGLDYDSYKMMSGTPYFQQAQQLAVIANAGQGNGWARKLTSVGTYSRMAYIEDALNANTRFLREQFFDYHYNGLDLLGSKPDDGRINIAQAIDSLVTLKRENSSVGRSVFFRAFFEAKYPELSDLARLFPDNIAVYFQKLGYLDPTHQNYYEQARQRFAQ
jgi:hypothetical protein